MSAYRFENGLRVSGVIRPHITVCGLYIDFVIKLTTWNSWGLK